jgi:hypothetical protein
MKRHATHRPWLLLLFAALVSAGCRPGESGDDYGELTRLADLHQTDKGSRDHQFTRAYELYFHPIRHDVRKVFEIGVLRGASMKMWRDYFPNATIYGADIEPKTEYDSDRIKTLVADQSRREELQRLIDLHGTGYDVVLDDGGHTMEQQQVSFGYLFPHVKPGGYYVIEDVHTSRSYPHYGVKPDRSNTTFTMFVNYVMKRRIESEYMTEEEAAYITRNIDFAHMHVGNEARSMAWILRKRDDADTP